MAKKQLMGCSCDGDCYLHKTKCDGKLYGFRNNQPEEITGGPSPSDNYIINGLNPNGVHATTPGLGANNNYWIIETGRFIAAGPVIDGNYNRTLFDFDSDYIRMKFGDGTNTSSVVADATGLTFSGAAYKFGNVGVASTTDFVYVEQSGQLKKITTATLSGLLNIDFSNYYTKSQTYSRTEIDNLLSNLNIDIFIIVPSLPATGIANKIYLVSNSGSETGNIYDEYIWLNGEWEKLGQMTLSLDGYYTKTEADTRFAPISHSHPTLTLQIAGTTIATYNAMTATTFNVTPALLNVYDKDEIDSQRNDYLLKPAQGTDSNGAFTLVVNRDIYRELSIGSNFNLTDAAPSVVCGTIYYLLVTNTSSTLDILVTCPTGSNYINQTDIIEIPFGTTAEIAIKGYGAKRAITYLILGE